MTETSSPGGAAESTATTIEFRCSTCGKLLRITELAAGQSVKCPECNGVMRAPSLGGIENTPLPQPPDRITSAALPPIGPAGGSEPILGLSTGPAPPDESAAVATATAGQDAPTSPGVRRTKELYDRIIHLGAVGNITANHQWCHEGCG